MTDIYITHVSEEQRRFERYIIEPTPNGNWFRNCKVSKPLNEDNTSEQGFLDLGVLPIDFYLEQECKIPEPKDGFVTHKFQVIPADPLYIARFLKTWNEWEPTITRGTDGVIHIQDDPVSMIGAEETIQAFLPCRKLP